MRSLLQYGVDHLHDPPHRAALTLKHLLRCAAHALTLQRIAQQLQHAMCQLCAVSHAPGAVMLDQAEGDLLEVERVRSNQHTPAARCRFQHIGATRLPPMNATPAAAKYGIN